MASHNVARPPIRRHFLPTTTLSLATKAKAVALQAPYHLLQHLPVHIDISYKPVTPPYAVSHLQASKETVACGLTARLGPCARYLLTDEPVATNNEVWRVVMPCARR